MKPLKAPVECRHHWRIEPARGEFSDGSCTLCGATRSFRNWEPDLAETMRKQNGGKNKISLTQR